MINENRIDQKRRNLVSKYENQRLEYISIISNLSLPNNIRYHFSQLLNQLPRDSSKTRIKNRCIRTGRARSVYRFFKLSRIQIRELAGKAVLPGVIKSSW